MGTTQSDTTTSNNQVGKFNKIQCNTCDITKCTELKSLLSMFKDCDNDISEHKDNISDILDNFHHLLSFHDTDKDFESIYKQLHSCNINDCKLFARNYRNRDKIKDNNQKRKELYNTNDTDIISLYQIMDKIHCYYYHTYDIEFREKPNINIIEEKKSFDKN
eukprot:22685_1